MSFELTDPWLSQGLLLFRGRAAFGNEIARMISLAFDNEVVLTDDFASSLRRLMSPLPQNKTIVYFGFPEGIGQLVPPLSQKQTDNVLVCFWVPSGVDKPLSPSDSSPNLEEQF